MNFLTILLTQNLFHDNRFMRNISLNVHYFFIFPSKRDNRQFSVLARQIDPKNHSFLESVYERLSEESYFNYIMLDLHPQSDRRLTVRSDITNPSGATVWLPSTAASSHPDVNMSPIIDKSERTRMCVILKKILFFFTTKNEREIKNYIRNVISDSELILLKEACINILTGDYVQLSRKQFKYLNTKKNIIRQLGSSKRVNKNIILETRRILIRNYDVIPYIIRASLHYLHC
jgi:hypothetical protein